MQSRFLFLFHCIAFAAFIYFLGFIIYLEGGSSLKGIFDALFFAVKRLIVGEESFGLYLLALSYPIFLATQWVITGKVRPLLPFSSKRY